METVVTAHYSDRPHRFLPLYNMARTITGPISRDQVAAYLGCDANQINPEGLAELNRQLTTFAHKYYATVHDGSLGTTYDGIGPVVEDYRAELLTPIDGQQ